jgi:glycosyltransferase involved in cell wall biosynthesis
VYSQKKLWARKKAAAPAKDARALRDGNNEPLVSILIPVHNSEDSIGDTLRSALGQTWLNTEIIVVDDGSTDRTAEVVRRFEGDGVRLVLQRSQGASAARNKAFSLSHGDYIQWLDADDLLSPDKIATQVNWLSTHGGKRTLVSCAWGKFLYRYYRAKFVPTALWCDLSPVEWLLRKMGQNIYMQTGSWLMSRELTEAVGPWDTRLTVDDDGEYFSRAIMASDGVQFVPEGKVYYRGPGFRSLSHIGESVTRRESQWLSMQLHVKYIRSLEDSERVRAACVRYLRESLIHFYPEQEEIVGQARELAKELGEDLGSPKLSWKYRWIDALFGFEAAKNTQLRGLDVKWWVKKNLDKAVFLMEGAKSGQARVPIGRTRRPQRGTAFGNLH